MMNGLPCKIGRLLLVFAIAANARAAVTDLATAPLVTSSTTAVLPNLMFILDDSGSMGWDFLPDWTNDNYCKNTTGSFTGPCCRDSTNSGSGSTACWTSTASFGTWRGHPSYMNGDFNGVYYNPSITYTPPLNADATSKASQTSANTAGWTSVKIDAYNVQNTNSINLLSQFPDMEWCTSTAYTTCLRNDHYILPGVVSGTTYATYHATTASGSGQAATGSTTAPTISATRSWGPHYYTIIPGEYCTTPKLRTCNAQAAANATYPYAARLRWCSNSALSTCQSVWTSSTYNKPRYPGVTVAATSTLTVSGTASTSLTSLKVSGLEILSGATTASTSSSTVATNIRTKINACTSAISGSCQIAGYSAGGSGSSVTITAPLRLGASVNAVVPVVTKTGSMTVTPAAFANGVTVPGSFTRVDIVPGTTSYPYPGTAAKASTRTDCAGTTCTYAEEMTNFANWWTYYHTRMQMMKSSTSIAFSPIDTRYRVGFFTISTSNTSTGTNFLNISTFDTTQKSSWYSKLFAANPTSSTPLRTALTKAGRIYAHSIGVDPVQYSCQQNFTILSTDGYWNDSDPGGYQMNGTTAVGNQDNNLSTSPRPYFDGGTATSATNTLSDVAAYYYNTDLRPTGSIGALGTDVSQNNVPTSGLDAAAHQHMTTFTLGLGASGYMQFAPSYATDSSGDYFDVKNGNTANSASGTCTWQTNGTQCNWPLPVGNTQTTIDDLWHAAINGHGSYFSASNPASLSTGLSSALAGVSARTGASAAATTSNPNVTSGDNFVFSSTFTTVEWDGELVRQQLDLTTGAVSPSIDWSAQALLDAKTSDSSDTRTIYTYDPANSYNGGGTNKLKSFLWGNLATAEQAYFTTPNISSLSQFCGAGVTCLDAASQADAAGTKLVNFLRGQRGNEGASTDTGKYYHQRTHVLGDIVSAEAVYVKAPLYNYTDTGYDAFKTANASRQGMAYVAANDGMLHAFNASSGQESWTYIPSLVLPNLYKLADKNYSSLHQYIVDGTPIVGDIYAGGAWKTILVGGLNGGGRGYYALDITNPASPVALWEFTYDTTKGSGYTKDANLGYTFGNPVITKLKNGTWVVLVTSGYNNVSPGDGKGYLYVLNAATGAIISPIIGTGTGSATSAVSGVCATPPCPSGLARINAWTDNGMYDNTALRAYGGDQFGNLWRFDVNGDVGAAGYDAQLLATFRGSGGNAQPVTTKPEIGDVSGNAVVYVGTGRYLGATDLSDTSPQSFYGVKDTLGSTSYGNPRASTNFIQQTLTDTTCPPGSPITICTPGQAVRTSSNNTVNFSSNDGWYIDLPDSGERSNTDPTLALGTLGFTTNVPNSSACTVGGYGLTYFLDYRTGSAINQPTNTVAGVKLGNALVTRPVFVRLPNNTVVELTRLSEGTTVTTSVPIGGGSSATRRVSWRELITDQ